MIVSNEVVMADSLVCVQKNINIAYEATRDLVRTSFRVDLDACEASWRRGLLSSCMTLKVRNFLETIWASYYFCPV